MILEIVGAVVVAGIAFLFGRYKSGSAVKTAITAEIEKVEADVKADGKIAIADIKKHL